MFSESLRGNLDSASALLCLVPWRCIGVKLKSYIYIIQRNTDFYKELNVELDFLLLSLVDSRIYTADKLSMTRRKGAYNK